MKLWPNAFKNLFTNEYCSKDVGRRSPSKYYVNYFSGMFEEIQHTSSLL